MRTSDARERLVSAALQLTWERGYKGVGVDELCKKAGVKPGSFYYFFSSKSELASAALEEVFQQMRSHFLNLLEAREVPARQRVEQAFMRMYHIQLGAQQKSGCTCGCMIGNLGAELGGQDHALLDQVREIFVQFRAAFERLIREGIEDGSIQLSLSEAPHRAKALLALLEGVLLLARAENNPGIIQDSIPAALALVKG